MRNLFVVVISADIEWRAIREILSPRKLLHSPFGELFEISIPTRDKAVNVIYFKGGWGKISAAASTQYVIDHYSPSCLINLGTCGGIAGRIEKGKIILATKTIVYDIVEQMGDYDEHIRHYSTELDLSFLQRSYPMDVVEMVLVSGDRDILPQDIPVLVERYGAVAADWESGAIAYVARVNRVPLLMLRGVTDLVSSNGGEAYGNIGLFEREAKVVLQKLTDHLGAWIDCMALDL